jgi:hypothetical protein
MPVTVSVVFPVLLIVIVASRDAPTVTSPKASEPLTPITRVGVAAGVCGVDGEVGDLLPPPHAVAMTTLDRTQASRVAMDTISSSGDGREAR